MSDEWMRGLQLALTASFALATVALPYTSHVSNHILLLAVTAWMTVEVQALGEESRRGRCGWRRPMARTPARRVSRTARSSSAAPPTKPFS